MIWPFGKSKNSKMTNAQALYFKSGAAFFEYQCNYGFTDIKNNVAIVALVLDAEKEFGSSESISINKDGSQLAALMVASKDGGFLVFATAPSSAGDKLKPDDCVLWVPSIYEQEMGSKMSDPRSGWIGLIRAKVEPKIDLQDPSFAIICRYS
jgi:hypothetical protein